LESQSTPRLWAGLSWLGLLVLIFLIARHGADAGISYDESAQRQYGDLILAWFRSGFADDRATTSSRSWTRRAAESARSPSEDGSARAHLSSSPRPVIRGESPPDLPRTGLVRLRAVLAAFPVGRSTWWRGMRTGMYPRPVKIGPKTTALRVEDIRALLASVHSA